MKENLRWVVFFDGECLLEGLLRRADLLIDELAADYVLCSQSPDGFGSRQRLDGQVLSLLRLHCLGRTRNHRSPDACKSPKHYNDIPCLFPP